MNIKTVKPLTVEFDKTLGFIGKTSILAPDGKEYKTIIVLDATVARQAVQFTKDFTKGE